MLVERDTSMMAGRAAPASWAVLRHRDFRLLWGSTLLSGVGSQMQVIAVNWQILQSLTGRAVHLSVGGVQLNLRSDTLGLGALGLARVVPIIALALFGGVLADALDRRRVIMLSQIVAAMNAGALAVLVISGNASLWILYGLTAVGVGVEAFDAPAQAGLLPGLVSKEQLSQAYSVSALVWPLGNLFGPAAAGLLIAHGPLGIVYVLDAASFLAVFLAVRSLRVRDTVRVERPRITVMTLADGLRFARRSPLVWHTLLIDLYATFFGSARTMVPLVAVDVLHAGPQGYGLLATAQPLGAALSSLGLSARRVAPRGGSTLLLSVGLFGAAWALFGFSTIYVVSYLLYALTGSADTVSYVIRTVIRQEATPDGMRGRIAGLHLLLGAAGPQLGEAESGVLATLVGVPLALATGGAITVMLSIHAFHVWPDPDGQPGSRRRRVRCDGASGRS